MDTCSPRIAVYPGTFDPLTNGHVSLVRRGLKIFDKVIVAIAASTTKNPMFSIPERIDMAKEVFQDAPDVTVESFDGLLVDYVHRHGVAVILRGLRAISDFEYEFQMALMNRRLKREIETVFLMTEYKWMYLSSTIIKEAAKNGGDINGLAPDCVLSKVYARVAELKNGKNCRG
ncbi:MAG: pantetheine-phosphate adenylyltransferase [Desulfovibrionales bacterium]|nr:pantetheine-phosphate adenylyltransferase [Desulfovibrionales bacterium]